MYKALEPRELYFPSGSNDYSGQLREEDYEVDINFIQQEFDNHMHADAARFVMKRDLC